MDNDLLLCELHAHTTWSDGLLTLTELVDLYGRHGFDVLCVTDHLLRSDDGRFRLRAQTCPLPEDDRARVGRARASNTTCC